MIPSERILTPLLMLTTWGTHSASVVPPPTTTSLLLWASCPSIRLPLPLLPSITPPESVAPPALGLHRFVVVVLADVAQHSMNPTHNLNRIRVKSLPHHRRFHNQSSQMQLLVVMALRCVSSAAPPMIRHTVMAFPPTTSRFPIPAINVAAPPHPPPPMPPIPTSMPRMNPMHPLQEPPSSLPSFKKRSQNALRPNRPKSKPQSQTSRRAGPIWTASVPKNPSPWQMPLQSGFDPLVRNLRTQICLHQEEAREAI